MNGCVRCLISGRVQGVWFRGSTREQALSLGLRGYARNLTDGRVEVLACGESEPLAAMKSWLREGPAAARVDHVDCRETDERAPPGFSTL